jgi:hypothetical protein
MPIKTAQERNEERERAIYQLIWLLSVRGGRMTQTELAAALGKNQPEISKLLHKWRDHDVPKPSLCKLIQVVFERHVEVHGGPDATDLPAFKELVAGLSHSQKTPRGRGAPPAYRVAV